MVISKYKKIGILILLVLIFSFIFINRQEIYKNTWIFDSWFFDKFVRLANETNHSASSVSILIDAPSLNETGFPIDRRNYAKLLNRMNRGKQQGPVVFDVIFGESTQTNSTTLLNKELQSAKFPLTLAGTLSTEWSPPLEVWNSRGNQAFGNEKLAIDGPYPPILNTVKDVGISDFFPDEDGVLRWYPLIHKVGGVWVPSLALSAWVQSLGANWKVLEQDEKVLGVKVDEYFIDLSSDPLALGRVLIVPPSKSSKWESKSFLEQDTIEFSKKAIFVGVNIPGISSFQNTSRDIQQVSVHIHQFIFDALCKNQLIQMNVILSLGLIFVWLLFTFLIAFRLLNTEFSNLIRLNLFLFASTIILSLILFKNGIFLSPFPVLPLILFNFFFVYYQKLSKSEKDKEFIRNSFSHYLSPELVDRMIKNNKLPELKGESRDIAIMFVDLRNFTSLSEKLDAANLVLAMNEFFELVGRNVMFNGGTIDKFIGDSVMAFWNAPGDTLDFQKKSVLAAQGVIRDFDLLCKKWKSDFSLSETPKLGIGLHCGSCIVGNVGGEGRFNYTALGDNVNLASRIEGLCKVYGVHILVSEQIANVCGEFSEDFFLLDEVYVKGKERSIKIYTSKKYFGLKVASDWSNFLIHYRMGSVDIIHKKLLAFDNLPWKEEFIHRLSIISTTPQGKWDGIWKFETK